MRAIAIIVVTALLLAAGFASANTIFRQTPSASDDFCFGYAICE